MMRTQTLFAAALKAHLVSLTQTMSPYCRSGGHLPCPQQLHQLRQWRSHPWVQSWQVLLPAAAHSYMQQTQVRTPQYAWSECSVASNNLCMSC